MEKNITKELIIRYSIGGIIYYYLKIPQLKKKNENTCHNVSSPFRKDSNPSFQVKRNPAINKWFYHDFGDPTSNGDVFDFAAQFYGLDVKSQFKNVLEKMYEDLKIATVDKETLDQVFFNGEFSNKKFTYPFLLGNRSTTAVLPFDAEKDNSTGEYKLELLEKCPEDLNNAEKAFLSTYGILIEVMNTLNAYFIKGYNIIYDSVLREYRSRDQIWIAYKYPGGAKIYCPNQSEVCVSVVGV